MRKLLSNGRIMRRQSSLVIVPIVLILAFVLASCGTNTGSGSSTGSTGSTPTSAPPTVKSTTGCPNNAVVNPAPVNPNVTIRLTNSNGTIVAHNGDLIEVRLPFGQQWSLPTTTGNVLQLQTPAGYAMSADKVCVWHFIAKGTGTAALSFSAKAICKPGQMCPLYIMRVPFTIDVK